jgi:hypothetical protein
MSPSQLGEQLYIGLEYRLPEPLSLTSHRRRRRTSTHMPCQSTVPYLAPYRTYAKNESLCATAATTTTIGILPRPRE